MDSVGKLLIRRTVKEDSATEDGLTVVIRTLPFPDRDGSGVELVETFQDFESTIDALR